MENNFDETQLDKWISKFGLPNGVFGVPTRWVDGFGFSTIEDHKDGYASLYKIGIDAEEFSKVRKVLSVSVTYGKSTTSGVCLGVQNKGLKDPISLEFRKDFFFNSKLDKFFDSQKEVSASDILSRVREAHMKPTHDLLGFGLRLRLKFWRKILPWVINIVDVFLIKFLWLFSGEKLKPNKLARFFSDQPATLEEGNDVKIERGKPITFFGYEANRWSVVVYCSVHMVVYLFAFFVSPCLFSLFASLGDNGFLVLCYAVVSFSVFDSLIPSAVKYILKQTPTIFRKIVWRRI